ncbi:MAG: hypothetical protein JSS86_18785 [Cyanobacteria bacterium SZAS LIN-2]|nr:hypothetical protein [Cyanobacteria bacterium SZAS LIN-2]
MARRAAAATAHCAGAEGGVEISWIPFFWGAALSSGNSFFVGYRARRFGMFVCGFSVLLMLAGCAGLQRAKFDIVDSDFDVIAEASLKKIDPRDTITTIVVPADTDPRARKALSRLHPVVAPAQVQVSSDLLLPGGYFLLHSFRVELDGALFEGQLGPVTRHLTQANLQDCGKMYSVPFFLRDGDWYTPNYKVSTCDEKRIWWPADEAPPPEAKIPQSTQPVDPY